MKILVHGINYFPESVGIGQYTTEFCEYLAERGHEVTVVTGVPYYPWWEIQSEYRGQFFARDERNGVRVLRTWHHVPKRVTTFGRILHELSFTALSGVRVLAQPGYDLLLTVSPPLFLGAVARTWSAMHRSPYVFLVQDLQPDAAADLGMLDMNPLMRMALPMLFGLERWTYEGSTASMMLTEGMRSKVLAKGIEPGKVLVQPDWVDGNRLKPMDGKPFREKHGLGDRFVVLHAGNMGVKQGLETVLGAADLLRQDENILFLLVGEGARKQALQEQVREMQLGNVRFLPLQPREEVAVMHAAADVCLLSQRPEVSDIVMPCKVLGIFSCGRPILAAANPGTEVAHVVETAGAGLLVTPGDPGSLAEAILSSRNQPERRRIWGDRARAYALKHWDREIVLAGLEKRLLAIVNGVAPHA